MPLDGSLPWLCIKDSEGELTAISSAEVVNKEKRGNNK